MSIASLLDAHLEQISACAQTIAELNFPRPRIFANALLQPHDITALIRDTEAHERALFTVPSDPKQNRRSTVFPAANGPNALLGGPPSSFRGPRRNTAVAAVLGGDLVERIKRGSGNVGNSARERGDVDVDVLLEGAEKLCGVYPISGATTQIASLRQRHSRLASSISYYETKSADQAKQLNEINKADGITGPLEDEAEVDEIYTQEDLRKAEQEVTELERKKKSLEERVTSMENDLNYR